MDKLSTDERILESAMNLFSEKGYREVTTKDIAKEAGVSEMSIFRHFHNKKNLFERAVDKYIFSPKLRTLFDKNLKWDLKEDLLNISRVYHEALTKNERIILVCLKNTDLTVNLDSPLKKFPNELKKLMVAYFIEMQERGVLHGEPELLAINFIAGNFGIFTSFTIFEKFNTNLDVNTCINDFVKIFIEGVIPDFKNNK